MTCEHSKGTSITVAVFWQYTVFLAAADLVMIAWVYTMWNQSKRILGVLLFIYVPQVIFSSVVVGILSTSNAYFTTTVSQVFGSSFCDLSEPRNSLHNIYPLGVRLPLGVIMLVFAVTQTSKQSVQMYKATKQWQPNKYMQLFVKDGIYYFLGYVTLSPLFRPQAFPSHPTTHLTVVESRIQLLISDPVLLGIVFRLSCISLIPLMPRLIIGVRELYDRGTRRGHRQRIDTVFGVLSQPTSCVESTMVFMDVTTSRVVEGEVDGLEAIQLEVSEDNTHV
ncbi:hypothetical protein L210DRAFT_1026475 [Boletus edulis BED1]|uniref:Uncharacterized protein n=1 Tax=Boletus edulis BED1 TaxID=1328754 RepID=A0AAD4BRG8_BOLED|nr:hypothetical protein L210DRAFT_1026475 [Boletus edulis BED1]